MSNLHRGIVLRASSPLKHTLVLLDEQYGKIESVVWRPKKGQSLCHGALISYVPQKRRIKYVLEQQELIDMPLEWARQDFLFFHYVLELCSYFLQWDEPAPEVFALLEVLYSNPALFQDTKAQKTFLCKLFRCFGMYPELTKSSLAQWFKMNVAAHFDIQSLRADAFLKILDRYEDCP